MVNIHPDEDRDAQNQGSAPHRNAKPGEIVVFGLYSQTADGVDRTPIRWRVLQNSGGELFLVSEYLLDCKRYHRDFVDITWRDCDLRKWLNEEFYAAALNTSEREMVKTTLCTDNGEGRPDTEDKVFLLSVAEVRSLTAVLGQDSLDKNRRAVGTEFAKVKKADGCHLYVYNGKVEDCYITENGRRYGCSWWWLRTQLGAASRAAFVGMRGSIRGYGRVNRIPYGVRPALHLKLPA